MRIREFDKSYRVICLVAILGLIGFFYPAGAQEPPAPVKSAPVSEAQSEAEAENESDPEPEPLSTPAPATTPEAAPVSVPVSVPVPGPAPAPSPAVQQGPPVPKFEVLEKVYKEPVERNPHLKKKRRWCPLTYRWQRDISYQSFSWCLHCQSPGIEHRATSQRTHR